MLILVPLLLAINGLQAWTAKRAGRNADVGAPLQFLPSAVRSAPPDEANAATREPAWVSGPARRSLAFFAVFLLMPLVAVFVERLPQGLGHLPGGADRAGRPSAIKLTLIAALIAVPSTWSSAWPRRGRSPSSSSAASTC